MNHSLTDGGVFLEHNLIPITYSLILFWNVDLLLTFNICKLFNKGSTVTTHLYDVLSFMCIRCLCKASLGHLVLTVVRTVEQNFVKVSVEFYFQLDHKFLHFLEIGL